jgi:hypothetical protein
MNMDISSSVAITDQLIPRPTDKILLKHGDNIWDGISPNDRQRVSEDDLDELDDEEHIFTDKGLEILCYYPIFTDGRRIPYGVLVDFQNLNGLFQPDIHLTHGRAGPSTSRYSAYPQAGLVTAGYIQATSLISEFYPLLESINIDILNAGAEDFDEDPFVKPGRWLVYGISCQIYNAVMHHTRGRGSQHHKVARGLVSGVLGGLCIPETASSVKAENLHRTCTAQLPHKSFKIKASNSEVCKDLRLENVYWVDLDQIPEEQRNGR